MSELSAYDELVMMKDSMITPGKSWPSPKRILTTAFWAIADRDAEIERLEIELAGYRGDTILRCLERDIGSMTGMREGQRLRTTDTHREFTWSVPYDAPGETPQDHQP